MSDHEHNHDEDDDECSKPIMERRICGCSTVKKVVDDAISHAKDVFSGENCAIYATAYCMMVAQIAANFNRKAAIEEHGGLGTIKSELLNQSIAALVRQIFEDDDTDYITSQIEKALQESIDIKEAHRLAVGANLN